MLNRIVKKQAITLKMLKYGVKNILSLLQQEYFVAK